MLLILTSDTDLTADFLIVELLDRKLPYFRLNAEELVGAKYQFSDSGVRRISVGPRSVEMSEVTAVWYRRAIYPAYRDSTSLSERVFASGEFRHLVFGMVWNPKILWVNPIDKVYIAEHKIYQLEVARQVGLRVPKTVVSTDPVELQTFAASNPDGTICKPIFHGLYIDGPDSYSVYTRRVGPDEFNSNMEIDCPILLQEEVPRSRDLRITFVGKQCFAAAVHGSTGSVDWREPAADATFSATELDLDTKSKCESMLQTLGLHYGAFDFIQRPNGDLIFLEVNPTGEWAWLENALGFPIRRAFVDLFYGGTYA
jgi:glutathione synthase/RimK-type ligase-like ATP-grasp enzyme